MIFTFFVTCVLDGKMMCANLEFRDSWTNLTNLQHKNENNQAMLYDE